MFATIGVIVGAAFLIVASPKELFWAERLASLLITAASLVTAFLLLFSKSTIAFLEKRKQTPKEPDKTIQEPSHPVPQYHEFSEKIRSHLVFELPTYEISTILPVKDSEDKIVMMKYVAAFSNIFRCKPDGSMVWQAELPTTSGDVYTNVEWKDEYITAFSRSCVAVHLDVETGKIVPSKAVP